MSLEMLADLMAGVPEPVRLLLALVTTAVLAFWTWERAVAGSGEDPDIAVSAGDTEGSFSFLVSGIIAVVFVAVGWILGLAPEVQQQPALLVIPAAFVVAHYIFEVRET